MAKSIADKHIIKERVTIVLNPLRRFCLPLRYDLSAKYTDVGILFSCINQYHHPLLIYAHIIICEEKKFALCLLECGIQGATFALPWLKDIANRQFADEFATHLFRSVGRIVVQNQQFPCHATGNDEITARLEGATQTLATAIGANNERNTSVLRGHLLFGLGIDRLPKDFHNSIVCCSTWPSPSRYLHSDKKLLFVSGMMLDAQRALYWRRIQHKRLTQ